MALGDPQACVVPTFVTLGVERSSPCLLLADVRKGLSLLYRCLEALFPDAGGGTRGRATKAVCQRHGDVPKGAEGAERQT